MEERKLDLKINFDKLEELSGKLKSYYDALSTMKTSVDNIQKKIEADNKGKSITALMERYEAVSKNISASKTEMKDVYILIDGYQKDLKQYIKPLDSSKTMRVDRYDIYWNLQSLKSATDAITTSYTYHKTEFISGLTENSTEATNNYAKMEEIWNTLIPNFQDKIDILKDDINRIYKNKVIKFDEVDLDYQKKAARLLAKYSSIPEVVLDAVSDEFEVEKDIFVGTAEAIGGFMKEVGTLALFPEIQLVESVKKTINGIDALTKGEYEEWAKGEEAKQDAILDGIQEFFENPGEVIESGLEKKFQDLSDEADVEGISYVVSREGTKIGIDIGVAVATDGLLSGEGVAGKAVVSGEAVAAETAGIKIGAAAEEAVGKAVASGLDDVVEGGATSWFKADGSINYPPNNGAVPGTELNMSLKTGDVIGRYGDIGDRSNFVTQAGADASKLSLPPNTNPSIYQEFDVIKEIPNTIQAEIAAWGNSSGGGLQYELPMPILQLIKEGYIVPK